MSFWNEFWHWKSANMWPNTPSIHKKRINRENVGHWALLWFFSWGQCHFFHFFPFFTTFSQPKWASDVSFDIGSAPTHTQPLLIHIETRLIEKIGRRKARYHHFFDNWVPIRFFVKNEKWVNWWMGSRLVVNTPICLPNYILKMRKKLTRKTHFY